MIFNKRITFPDLTFSRINLENCGHPLGAWNFPHYSYSIFSGRIFENVFSIMFVYFSKTNITRLKNISKPVPSKEEFFIAHCLTIKLVAKVASTLLVRDV